MSQSSKILVVYFSHTGKTRSVANNIAQATGADILELVPTAPYPADYDSVVAQAKREIGENFLPDLKSAIPDVSGYDTFFIGSPCWWGTIAPPVATFLSKSDLTGKKIAPFMTHEGSGLGRSADDIHKKAAGATLLEGFAFRGGAANKYAADDVARWVRSLNIEVVNQ